MIRKDSQSRSTCRKLSCCALLGLSWLVCAGCDFPGQPKEADRPVPENQVVEFAPLYRRNCSGCHGAEGRLGPAPPLNDPLFLAIVSDDELLRAIERGRRGTPMPAFAHEHGGELTDTQVQVLAKGIKAQWKAAVPEGTTPPEYLLTAADQSSPIGNRKHGAEVFAHACATCHGERGADGKSTGGMAGPIDDPAFLTLISNQALRRIIITGRPDLGMPNFAESDGRADDFQPLSSADMDDLVALLASWRAPAKLASAVSK